MTTAQQAFHAFFRSIRIDELERDRVLDLVDKAPDWIGLQTQHVAVASDMYFSGGIEYWSPTGEKFKVFWNPKAGKISLWQHSTDRGGIWKEIG